MRTVRIIPRLDVKGGNLVKGVRLEGLRVLGLPEEFADRYYRDGADELIYIDPVASLYGRNSLVDMISRTASRVFVPLTVGGGVRSVEDMRLLLRSGADKVAVNTAAHKDPELIERCARVFGSQCVVVSIEAIGQGQGRWLAYTDNGREPTGRDAVEWAREAAERGAGEILLTSVDREGAGKGYDIELTGRVCRAVSIPVVACGGAGSAEDAAKLVSECDVGGVSAASIFHYRVIQDLGVRKRDEGNVEYLKNFQNGDRSLLDNFQTMTVRQMKQSLGAARLVQGPDLKPEPESLPATTYRPAKARLLAVAADHGRGNMFSLERALSRAGARVEISPDPDRLRKADLVVLAGVGSFGDCMQGLAERGLDRAVIEEAARGKPVLGICLGMQLFMEQGEEFGWRRGLGLIPGRAIRLDPSGNGSGPVRLPHIGWNRVFPRDSFTTGLFKGIEPGEFFYFVHSFHCAPDDPGAVAARTNYGRTGFCSVLVRDNLVGCQFHPERSGPSGLKLYENIVARVLSSC